MKRNRPWAILAATIFGVVAGAGSENLGLLAAAAAIAVPLTAMAAGLAARLRRPDPHDALVRRIERQMKAHRRAAARSKKDPARRVGSDHA